MKLHVCSKPGCPELVDKRHPCPAHGRPVNAPWSQDRDRDTQRAFRTSTLTHDGYTCQRCGQHDPTGRTLDAHHLTPTSGITLCNSRANGCHAAVDRNAR